MTVHKKMFPLFIDMNDKKVLIIGGGNVASRRAETLVNFGANVTVISPEVSEYIERAALSNTIHLLKRKYHKGDIADIKPFLVIAATNERETNREIMTEAESHGIFASIADCRDECTFHFPAIMQNENYVAGIVSTNGDHAGVKEKARKIREIINL